MRPTYYLALRSSLPLPAGSPVVLLPHGVPAYYLSTYNGPTTALTAQFEDALAGLGAGDWKRTKVARSSDTEAQDYPSYVVVWLAVQNKRGEDKGMPVIWPVSLCACYHANSPSTHARSSLPYIPELPAQLQASPPPPAAAVPPTLSFSMAATATPTTDIPTSAATTNTPTSAVSSGDRDRLTTSFQSRPNLLRSSPTSDSLRAFRGLSLHKKPYVRDVNKVASEVSGYVESVVKERERERERIRKERQEQELAAARAKLASSQPPVPELPPVTLSTPEPTPVQQEDIRTLDEPSIPPVESAEPEFLLSVESDNSDHSVDSLFSPPDANIDLPSTEEEPQAVLDQSIVGTPTAVDDAQIATQPVHTSTVPTSGAFDPFSTFDSAWEPQQNSYMDIDDDYGMDFNIDSLGGARTGGASVGAFDMNEEFTEDDFACFDAPPTQGGVDALVLPSMTGPVLTSGPSLASLGLPPLVAMDGTLSGPGPPATPWPTTHLGEPFTPRGSVDMHNVTDGIHLPDLLPPSPTKTPSSHSAPATPSVHLDEKYRGSDGRKYTMNMLGPSIFDPIPFASSHREIDGKYAIGKFALPSPPADMDRAEPVFTHPASTSTLLAGWKHKYSAVTDPRIGVVRKLIGVKRKSMDQGLRAQRRAPHWDSYREAEEWQSSSPPPADVDSEESEEESWMEEEVAVATVAPRPSTPPPSYLPLGPTLLRTHFHHAHLLPMCTPLRPLGMAVNSTSGNTAMNSAPTPVSPAAVLGAASEKTKSLEAAAQVLVKEVVDNPLWSEAWRATASLSLTSPVLPGKIWQADARYIKHLVGDKQMPVDLQTLLQEVPNGNSSTSLQPLDAPMLLVGKGDSVIQLSPTSLRFWEKLGLSPRAGQKDVTAFVFFEGTDEERENEIEGWLSKVSAAYSAKSFGLHVAGMSSHHTKPGLVPTRFDTLRKTLMSFISSIPTRLPHLVFYIATPLHIISSSSTTLRQILSAVRRFHRAHPEGDILVHFVPESLILGTHTHPASILGGLDTFVCSVYDRILQPVSRAMSRKFFDMSAPIVEYFEAPAYALISSPVSKSAPHLKISYSLDPSISSLDVTHRHSFLHIGYQISTCGRWILAACVDAEGEAHELKTWLTPDDHIEEFVVTQVWTFVLEFARRANIEWRIVVSKLGYMAHSELEAWVSHLDSSLSSALNAPPVYVTVIAVDNECPWTFLVPQESGSYDVLKRPPISTFQSSTSKTSRHTHTTFSDATCATYSLVSSSDITLYPAYSVERSVKSGLSPYIPGSSDQPFVPDLEDEETPNSQAQSPSTEPMRVPGWSTILCAPSTADHASISSVRLFQLHVAHSPHSTYGKSRTTHPDHDAQVDAQLQSELMNDIVRNFHELAVLSRTRWKLHADPALPFHLAALEVMRAALSGGAVDP
ncbi:mediator complex subunit 13 C-terminal-domain-containing protein [Daedaleopsis nitida]|nr:mediator complex subunit 13 C-terminal-domain-containing protein [Daedaleopsis nitida]